MARQTPRPKTATSGDREREYKRREKKRRTHKARQALAHLLGFCPLAGVKPTEKERDLVGVLRTGVVPMPSLSETQQPSLNLPEKPKAPSSSLILGEGAVRLVPVLLLRLILYVYVCIFCYSVLLDVLLSVRGAPKTVGHFLRALNVPVKANIHMRRIVPTTCLLGCWVYTSVPLPARFVLHSAAVSLASCFTCATLPSPQLLCYLPTHRPLRLQVQCVSVLISIETSFLGQTRCKSD